MNKVARETEVSSGDFVPLRTPLNGSFLCVSRIFQTAIRFCAMPKPNLGLPQKIGLSVCSSYR
jgi:hypothetical protein